MGKEKDENHGMTPSLFHSSLPIMAPFLKMVLIAGACSLVMISFSGCIGPVSGSGGFESRAMSSGPDEADNPFKLSADNWLEFDGDLTSAIDSIFARIAAGDHDAQQLASDFVRPGLDVLANRYDLLLPQAEPRADFRAREFRFNTPWSSWTISRGGAANSPITKVTFQHGEAGNCQWRGRIVDSYLKFNSLTPKRIYVHFVLELAVEIRSSEQQPWTRALIDQHACGNLAQAMRKDILNRYRDYLSTTYNVDTSSPRFRGFHEN